MNFNFIHTQMVFARLKMKFIIIQMNFKLIILISQNYEKVDIFPLNDSPPTVPSPPPKVVKKWKCMKSSENIKNHKKRRSHKKRRLHLSFSNVTIIFVCIPFRIFEKMVCKIDSQFRKFHLYRVKLSFIIVNGFSPT